MRTCMNTIGFLFVCLALSGCTHEQRFPKVGDKCFEKPLRGEYLPGGRLFEFKDFVVDGITVRAYVDDEKIFMLSCRDKGFQTPEGVIVGKTQFSELAKIGNARTCVVLGEVIELPSGWYTGAAPHSKNVARLYYGNPSARLDGKLPFDVYHEPGNASPASDPHAGVHSKPTGAKHSIEGDD